MGFNQPFVYNDRVEEIAKRARNATTLEELTNICHQLNIADTIFLGKMDIKLCKYALTALYRTLRIYPELRPYINYFGTWNGFVGYKRPLFVKMYPGLPQDAVDFYIKTSDQQAEEARDMFKKSNGIGLAMKFGIIYGSRECMVSAVLINGKTFHEDVQQKELQMNEQAGFHPVGCGTIKSVIDHELGHMLDFVLDVSQSNVFKQFISQFTVRDLERHLSGYCVCTGRPEPAEILAEAYAEYRNNPNPRPIAVAIGQMIDNAYCEHFRPAHFDTNLFRKNQSALPNPDTQSYRRRPPTRRPKGGGANASLEDAFRRLVGDDITDKIKNFFKW